MHAASLRLPAHTFVTPLGGRGRICRNTRQSRLRQVSCSEARRERICERRFAAVNSSGSLYLTQRWNLAYQTDSDRKAKSVLTRSRSLSGAKLKLRSTFRPLGVVLLSVLSSIGTGYAESPAAAPTSGYLLPFNASVPFPPMKTAPKLRLTFRSTPYTKAEYADLARRGLIVLGPDGNPVTPPRPPLEKHIAAGSSNFVAPGTFARPREGTTAAKQVTQKPC